ncbi:MAG: thymidine phosphorylase, partial [Propionibacteriales bacterium]
MAQFDAVDLIRKKRSGASLTADEITWLVDSYTSGIVADEQMSAFAMAVFFQSMQPDELSLWTNAMIATGERLDFSSLSRPTAD